MSRALFVKNLSYNVTPEDLFELFGKFGAVRYIYPLPFNSLHEHP